jgi:hypothetical protein
MNRPGKHFLSGPRFTKNYGTDVVLGDSRNLSDGRNESRALANDLSQPKRFVQLGSWTVFRKG